MYLATEYRSAKYCRNSTVSILIIDKPSLDESD